MNQADRTRVSEAVATLMEISKKYNTPINLNVSFETTETGLLSIKMLGTDKTVRWFPEYDRLSHSLRAANMMCWLNYDLDKDEQ